MNKEINQWNYIVNAANAIRQGLNYKPENEKIGFQISPGGILNAYREGDLNFEKACDAIQELKTIQGIMNPEELIQMIDYNVESVTTEKKLNGVPRRYINAEQCFQVIRIYFETEKDK